MKAIKSHKCFEGLTQFWEHESKVTKTTMKFSSFIPAAEPRGCIIWLSGLTCTEENFITKAGAQRYLAEKQLMVVCPDTSPRGLNLPGEHDNWDFGSGAGFYVDATTEAYRDHYRMYSYIADEFYGMIQSQFPVENRISIMGHSMGGHGALVIGLRQPEQFRSISAFAPISNPMRCPWGEKAFGGYLGQDRSAWEQYDASELLKKGHKHPKTILIDQGLQDEFLEKQLMTSSFQAVCKEAGQQAEFHFREGYDHSYYYIATFIEQHINFHAATLN